MPDIILPVDTAVVVPVNLLPLLDDTDFKTRETAIVYNSAGMDLVWNFVTSAGVVSQTAVTPDVAFGIYEWTHLGDGMYTLDIPASGGASINNNTAGFGWFSGLVTGVLPWRGPVIAFVPAMVVNSLVAGTDTLQADVTQVAGAVVSTTTAQLGVNAVQWAGAATGTGNIALKGTLAKTTDITGFTDLSAAAVNAEVVDALNVDTYAEPGQEAPPATTTLVKKIGYLYKLLRNKVTQSATTLTVYADDTTTVDQKATVSDDGSLYTRNEIVSGP